MADSVIEGGQAIPSPDAPSEPSVLEQAFLDNEPVVEADETVEEVEDEVEDESTAKPVDEPTTPQLTPEQVEAYLQLDALMKSNPDFVNYVNKFFEAPTPEPEKPTADANSEIPAVIAEHLENPIVKALWEQNQAHAKRFDDLTNQYNELFQDIQARRNAEYNAAAQTVVNTFQSEYELEADQVHKVRDAAAKLMPTLLNGVDPITNEPIPDVSTAFKRAMEIAYWQMPDMRERELTRQASQQQADTKRKAKAGSLSGSSGSSKRDVAVSKDPNERKEQMIRAVADAMGVN